MKAILALTLVATCHLFGQGFDSGSDGSDGILEVPNDSSRTLQIPEDGIFNFESISIGFRANLYFIANSANTPVYLLSQGDVYLQGRIYVNAPDNTNRIQPGLGGPGGFPGGYGGANPGDGLGPGGGKGGVEGSGSVYRGGGSYATQAGTAQTLTTRGEIYGNPLCVPLVGGSGGGGATSNIGGAGGGGAICIASSTQINCAINTSWGVPLISALGGNSNSGTGCGSGGAIRLVAPSVIGSAYFDLRPGSTTWGGYGWGRIDSLNPSQYTLRGNGDSVTYTSQGANLVVFPPNQPTIRISEAAGTVVAPERVDPVFVLLPVGAPNEQEVEVTVNDFGTNVPLRVTITPEQGEKATYDLTIDNTAGGSSTRTVTVQIPTGTSTRIDAWTR